MNPSLLARLPGLGVWLLAIVVSAGAAPSLSPTDLRCEFRNNPLGLGEPKPRLSWKLAARESAARDLHQTAWQILVASSPEQLAQGHGDLWDSGKTTSALTNNLVYAGAALQSREACWWKVRIWDQGGEASAWSEPARWTMALLDTAEWKADWIGLDAPLPTDGTAVSDETRTRLGQTAWVRAPLEASRTGPLTATFRKSFTLPADQKVARATLLLTPDMRCAISLNGRHVGDLTRWDRATPLDITAALAAGENVAGLSIAQDDGYPPAVMGEIEVSFAGGSVPPLRIPIDPSWVCTAEASAGWDRAGFDATTWQPAVRIVDEKDPKVLKSPWGTPQNAFHFLAPAPYLRTSFAVSKPVRRATVYATALGMYELHLNGERVGRDDFTPGWTEYRRRLEYQTYDVTGQIRSGKNALGAMLGDGWYAGVLAYTGKRHSYGGMPRLRAQLEIEYADGTRDTIATGPTWRGDFGAVRYADLYMGCAYDERLVRPDWAKGTFDDSKWSPVVTGFAPGTPTDFILEAASMEPVRQGAELVTKAVTQPRPGTWIFDLGQNMVGWARLKVPAGLPGQKITVRYGEMLNPNGTLYTSNLRGATATDVFWLRGGGEETLEPWGTFHGFRYVEVTGLEGEPRANAVSGIVVHSAMERTGDFHCSDPLVNQLFHNIIWGQMGNYLEAPTDCPQRDERGGWTGDTQFFIRTGLFNYEVPNFFERWLNTLSTDSQGEDGTFPSTAPAIGHKPTAVTAWGDAALVCTHALWLVYGDTRVIERHFDEFGRYIDALGRKSKDGITKVGGYGDWLNKGGGAKTEVMDTAYYAHLAGLMAEMATAIGRTADAAKYSALHDAEVAAWRKAFLQPDGSILESSQTGYALAFTMGLLPDEAREKAAGKFVDDIKGRNWHLATGFIGTPRLLPALHAAGRDDVAYRLLMQDTYPSWLFQVKLGATTMWERWDGWTPDQGFQTIGMNSFNHYAFGAVGEYLYRGVAGLDTDGPGFRQIVVAPTPGGGLTEAHAVYDALTGKIGAHWKIEGGKFTLDVTVPPNVTATVRIPLRTGGELASVQESGSAASQAKGISGARLEDGEAVLRVGSGSYHFSTPAKDAAELKMAGL